MNSKLILILILVTTFFIVPTSQAIAITCYEYCETTSNPTVCRNQCDEMGGDFEITPVTTVADMTISKSSCSDDVYCLNQKIPGMSSGVIDIKGANPLGVYVSAWYNFIVAVVGLLATVMMMWGGFKWLASRGNAGEIGQAKEAIWSAVIGLILALLSYTILFIINPNLLTLQTPGLGVVEYTDSVDIRGPSEAVTQHDYTAPDPSHQGPYDPSLVGPPAPITQSLIDRQRQLANAGVIVAPGLPNNRIANMTDEAFNNLVELGRVAPPGSVTLNSGWRPDSHNHVRGDTVDINNNPEFDRFMAEYILSGTTGTTLNSEGFPMPTYNFPSGDPLGLNISRILDERLRDGASHWHIEF